MPPNQPTVPTGEPMSQAAILDLAVLTGLAYKDLCSGEIVSAWREDADISAPLIKFAHALGAHAAHTASEACVTLQSARDAIQFLATDCQSPGMAYQALRMLKTPTTPVSTELAPNTRQ